MGYLDCVISYPIGYHLLPGEDGHPPVREPAVPDRKVKFRSFTSDPPPIPPRARVLQIIPEPTLLYILTAITLRGRRFPVCNGKGWVLVIHPGIASPPSPRP